MKPKNLVPLAIVLVVLVGLVLLRQSSRETETLIEQVQLAALVPDGLDRDDIARVEFYAGDKPDQTLVLEKESSGNWIQATHYNSPVFQQRVDELFDVMVALKGEYRATASGDGLDTYDLADETAFHVLGYAAGESEPLFHVLTGKTPAWGDAFARAAGGEDIYIINVNIRREAGIYTLDLDDPPEPDFWLDKQILSLDAEAIKQVALTYPDKAIAFEYQEVETEKADAVTDTEKGEDEPAPDPTPAYEWVTTSGGTGVELNVTTLTNLTRRLASLSASDIVDPENTTEWNLDTPEYITRLSVDGEDEEIVIEAGRPTGSRDAYIRIASAEKNVVYKISGYDFEQIYPEGGEFYELPGILVDAKDVDLIEYTTDEGSVALSRADDAWVVSQPTLDAELLEGKLDTIARTVLAWKASDYSDSADGTGLDGETATVTITGDGISHVISVAGANPSEEGFYARLDELDQVLVMSERDEDQIFVAPTALFKLDLFDIIEGDIASIELTQDGEAATLTRGESGWTFTLGDETGEANGLVADDMASALSALKADKLQFESASSGDSIGSLSFTTDAEETFAFELFAEQDGLNLLRLPDRETGYWIASAQIDRLLPGTDALRKPEPEIEEDSSPEDE